MAIGVSSNWLEIRTMQAKPMKNKNMYLAERCFTCIAVGNHVLGNNWQRMKVIEKVNYNIFYVVVTH